MRTAAQLTEEEMASYRASAREHAERERKDLLAFARFLEQVAPEDGPCA